MTTPLSWLRKLPKAEAQQCMSDLRHHDKFVAEKVREDVLKRFEVLATAVSTHGEVGRRFGETVLGLIADVRAEPVKVGP